MSSWAKYRGKIAGSNDPKYVAPIADMSLCIFYKCGLATVV